MMIDGMRIGSKKRRRNCADRLRHHLAERQRQRRSGDPAGKVLLKLLGLLSGALALPPPLPAFSFPSGSRHSTIGPTPSREALPRSGQRANLDRLDTEDRGPVAFAMEHGIEPIFYRLSSRAVPTWSRLIKGLKHRQLLAASAGSFIISLPCRNAAGNSQSPSFRERA